MKVYLLLRNNVQSGPYSVDELKMLGLKAFDLIWIEGKSFSWKYPGEIDELRSFAPVVEQTVASIVSNLKEKQISGMAEPQSAITEITPLEAKIVPMAEAKPEIQTTHHEHNVISLPPKVEHVEAKTIKGGPAVFKVQIREKMEPERSIADEPYMPKEIPVINPRFEEPQNQEPVLETKFSQPMDDIRDKFIESRVIQPGKERGKNAVETFILVIGAVSLLGIGYLFGTSNKAKQEPQQVVANGNDKSNSQKQLELYEMLAPERKEITDQPLTPARKSNISANGIKKDKSKNVAKPAGNASVPAAPDSKSFSPAVVEKEKPAVDEKREYAKQHINELVSVKSNDYKRKFLGGITGLKLTVANGSAYTIDEVTVEVSYVKNNEDVFKTENIVVRNLWPGAVYTADAPSTNKGVKVIYKITNIKSKDLDL